MHSVPFKFLERCCCLHLNFGRLLVSLEKIDLISLRPSVCELLYIFLYVIIYLFNKLQDEEKLLPDEKIILSDIRLTKSTVTSTLKIASMSEELAGKYECRVLSNGEMRSKFYTLALKGKCYVNEMRINALNEKRHILAFFKIINDFLLRTKE